MIGFRIAPWVLIVAGVVNITVQPHFGSTGIPRDQWEAVAELEAGICFATGILLFTILAVWEDLKNDRG